MTDKIQTKIGVKMVTSESTIPMGFGSSAFPCHDILPDFDLEEQRELINDKFDMAKRKRQRLDCTYCIEELIDFKYCPICGREL